MTDFRAIGTIMGPAGLTAVFGMGTGGAPPVSSPESGRGGGQPPSAVGGSEGRSRGQRGKFAGGSVLIFIRDAVPNGSGSSCDGSLLGHRIAATSVEAAT